MSTTEPTNKTLPLAVEEKERLKRRAAERWTLQEAAAELSEQFHQVMSPADWLAVLEKLVPTEFVHSPNGEVQADELNALLDAHPRWKAIGTPRLPSARNVAEHVAGAWDYSMHAASWFDMAAVTPREAAGLLCQSDPLFEKANPENNTNDETGPDDFRLLLRVFSDVEQSSPGRRTLLEWLKIAKDRGCRHHSWIDKYLEVREKLGFPVAEVSKAMMPDDVPKVPADAAGTTEYTSVRVIEAPPVVQATDADDLSKTIEAERLLELTRLKARDEHESSKQVKSVVTSKARGSVKADRKDTKAESPWLVSDPRDPMPVQPWYTPARYFARQLVIENSALIFKKTVLADKVSKLMAGVGIRKRGGIHPLDAGTVLKAFSNVTFG